MLTEKIGCADFQRDVNAYLARHAPTAYYKSLSEIVDSGLYLPYIEAQMKRNVAPRTEAQLARGPCVDTYHDPKKIAFRDAVLGEMEKQRVDALVYPTWSNPPRKVGDMKSPAGEGWRHEESGGGQQPDSFAADGVSGDYGADGIYV